jgi:hypothetical protein
MRFDELLLLLGRAEEQPEDVEAAATREAWGNLIEHVERARTREGERL